MIVLREFALVPGRGAILILLEEDRKIDRQGQQQRRRRHPRSVTAGGQSHRWMPDAV